MKVLHICSYYIGSQLYKNLMLGLEELEVNNEIYIPVSSLELAGKNSTNKFNTTNLIYSNSFNKIDRFNFKIKTNKMYKDLLNKVDVKSVDIVHAHSLFTNGYLAYKLKVQKNIDYIVAVRNTDLNIFFKYMPWMRGIGVEILKNAKNIIFISYPYKDIVIEKYIPEKYKESINKKSHVIPNGVDEFWLKNLNNKSKTKSNKKAKLIYVGQINKNKNIDSTIKAIDNLTKKGYELEFNIIGTGKSIKKINKLIADNRDYIKTHGQKTKEELIEFYRKSDIFVMPSKTETFGLVYVEALTQGVPVIYTKGQGFDGYFKDGEVGYKVDCNSINNIEEKIEDLINNNLDIASYHKNIYDIFNWMNISKKYLNLYKYNIENIK